MDLDAAPQFDNQAKVGILRMILIPILLLLALLFYYFAEVHLMRFLAWASGDGFLNSFAMNRLAYNQEFDKIAALLDNPNAKTRLFALKAGAAAEQEEILSRLPARIEDEAWEVRVEALKIAAKFRREECGRVVTNRLIDPPVSTQSKRRQQIERELLVKALPVVSSPENAESLATLGMTTSRVKYHRLARDLLWDMPPQPLASQLYSSILIDPKANKARPKDIRNALKASAMLDLEGTFPFLIEQIQKGGKKAVLAAIEGLGYVGTEDPALRAKAKTMLESIAKPARWVEKTDYVKRKLDLAQKALERIERREKGLPDVLDEDLGLSDPPTPTPVTELQDMEELLSGYGSDAVTQTTGSDDLEALLEDVVNN